MRTSHYILSSAVFVCLMACSVVNVAQTILNPSFEGPPQRSNPPADWVGCNTNSTPDTQPGFWEVSKKASEGDTYIGLVTRGDAGPYANQNEDVQSQLVEPVLKGEELIFQIDLSFSDNWGHELSEPLPGDSLYFLYYDTPAKLKVYGGGTSCAKTELLWTSPTVDHTTWETYLVAVNPQEIDVSYLIFQADYTTESTAFGNLMLDNIRECTFNIDWVSDTTICAHEPLVLDITISNGTYKWQDGSEESIYTIKSEGTYHVTISNTCVTEKYEMVVTTINCIEEEVVQDSCSLTIPNVFTPNGDGANDRFEIVSTPDIARYQLNIYNRVGRPVFMSNKVSAFWDGTSNGSELPTGVYYYAINIQCIQETTIVDEFYKGWVTLMK